MTDRADGRRTITLPADLVTRAMALVPLIRDSRYPDTGAITEETAVALALKLGLDVLEDHLGSQPREYR